MARQVSAAGALLLALVAGCSTSEAGAGLDPFWSEFRRALRDGDEQAIVSLTRFPFELRGVVDGAPVESLAREEFLVVLERLLDQLVYLPDGGGIVSRSMSDLIRGASTPPALDPSGTARFQQFEFERVDGDWRFTRAFLEE